ncbi:hypothetical protein [Amycolatopsis azurea]|uniref:Uncharacterized protein n=1 Tax=Amycolatopsis azurea DSM 43854 TaxID=1238180 RepID=M2PMG9_9PSEU|nr:hypothetical protein [Amycolatopsis azurea]EMD25713.1 hypothetical protein C791_4608 [Amycolatopsis azurea DSM 43854]OOC02595.1 hypothetical protein B0293_31035 [Amycolatopsis azurea DSM 43854]
MSAPTVGEITVRQCVVRVIRRGGWSWGPDPRGLVQRVLDALPDLLAAEFDEHLTGDGPDLEITEPVLLTVRLAALAGLGRSSAVLSLERAVVDGGGPAPEPIPLSTSTESEARPSTSDTVGTSSLYSASDLVESPDPSVTTLFEELSARDELVALLALLPDETVWVYLTALAGESAFPPTSDPIEGPVVETMAELARRPALPEPPSTRAELAEMVKSPQGELSSSVPVGEDVSEGTRVTTTTRSSEETRAGPVLPFLLAGPLARTGYLDAIGPALSGVRLAEDASLFAAALAYKVLGRTAAAAMFAGLETVPDLTGFARLVRPALPVLDGVLALSLCRGHDPADPLLVTGVDDGLLLVDAQGLFPIAWAPDANGLMPHWTACGEPPVLVCDSPLPPTCLRDLASAGVRFITDVLPLREDPLTRLPGRRPLWTTGGVETRLAAELPAARLDDLVRALFVPLLPARELERTVALAASLALGMIAWQLWREREPPDPVLTLTRFADLEGTVRFTRDVVHVKLPLGRRHTDLWRGGALADVPNVVWLGGRTLTFSGG